MSVIEPKITPLISDQFPAFYQEDSPQYVAFVKAYYEWMEQNGKPLYYTRNFPELIDVDTTTSDVLVFIKEKFLKNIQFSTEANIRSIIKHCLDIYRSKGSQRCIDLLFRLVFNEVVGFYYPKDDLFMLSDGVWREPRYLEISLSAHNNQLTHKTIKGADSQATAFVDDVIRRTVQGRLIDVAYISAITGAFQTGEIIQPTDDSLSVGLCPTVIGSLTSIVLPINGSGQGYTIGDIVNIYSSYGDQAKALVSNTSNQSGNIIIDVNDGGYGYSTIANVIISETTLTLANVEVTNPYSRCYIKPLEILTQGSNTGLIVGMANLTLFINQASGTFVVGETVVQHNSNFTYDTAALGQATIKAMPSVSTLLLDNLKGVFRANGNVIGVTSQTTANVVSVSLQAGVRMTANTMWFVNSTPITAPCINAIVSAISLQTNTGFAIANNQLYSETVSVNINKLSEWTEPLNSAQYNFGNTMPTANSGTPFNQFLDWDDITVGKVFELYPTFITSQLDVSPMALLSGPYARDMNIWDKILHVTGISGTFREGELVTQTNSGARGMIQSSNSTMLYVQELRYNANNWFIPTTNNATIIRGESTGATANVTAVYNQEEIAPTGLNANVMPHAASGLGSVTEFKMLDSGFGYQENELIWFNTTNDYNANAGYGNVRLGTGGKGQGFYEQKGGFLSDQKKLFDGYYWQNFSYEIISSQTPDKYQDMMKKIGHVAGMIMFNRYAYSRTLDASSKRESIEIIQL